MKTKRIIAIAGVAILVLLYIVTFISAIFTSTATPGLFRACFIATFAVPIIMYAFLLVHKVSKDRAEAARRELDEALKNIADETDTQDDNNSVSE